MREGLRSGKKVSFGGTSICSLKRRGKSGEFHIENEQCRENHGVGGHENGGKVGKQVEKGRLGMKRKNVQYREESDDDKSASEEKEDDAVGGAGAGSADEVGKRVGKGKRGRKRKNIKYQEESDDDKSGSEEKEDDDDGVGGDHGGITDENGGEVGKQAVKARWGRKRKTVQYWAESDDDKSGSEEQEDDDAPLNIKDEDDDGVEVSGDPNVDVDVNASVGANKDMNKVGKRVEKGRRGRKRKTVQSPKESDDDKNVSEEKEDDDASSDKKDKDDEVVEVRVNPNVDVNASIDAQEDVNKIGKPKRGRKRKNVGSKKDEENDGTSEEGAKKEGGLALTSDCTDSSRDSSLERCVKEEKCKTEDMECIKNAVSDEGKQKPVKGRRGRKRKRDNENERKQTKDSEVPISGRVLRSRSGNTDTKKDERPRTVDKPKKVKGRLGRPPKLTTNGSQKVMRLEDYSDEPKVKHTIQDSEKSATVKQTKTSTREEKQLVRDQIIGILLKAGWSIEYRQRQSKDYRDAVYVDLEGKTHWSVTKAYYRLKERVESGDADEVSVSAFEPIPKETLSILFRVTDKGKKKMRGRGKSGSKTGKTIGGKKLTKNKYATKSAGVPKHKGKLKSAIRAGAKKSIKKKMKLGDTLYSDQNDSVDYSQREKKMSNRETRKGRKPYALLARSSGKGSDQENDGFVPYDGNCGLLSWMIDLGMAPSCAKVKCLDSRVEGKLSRDGILCDCCNETVPVSKFLSHSGTSVGHDSHPLNDIYLGSGVSLLRCLVNSWSKHKESNPTKFCHMSVHGEDPNDDTCNICADGGDLICCDCCPATFHQDCLDIENFPAGEWRCIYCICKFCKTTDGTSSDLLTCLLCEEKFHQLCIRGEDVSIIRSFCGANCQQLFDRLQALLGVKHQMEDGFSYTLLQHSDVSEDMSLGGAPLKLESNAKLALAFCIMDECFLPSIDPRSKINMIQNVIYSCGSNFRRLDFSGFFTIILERGDEIISAASIRIHGNLLAEMPFIGTRNTYRRQGMCRRLLNAIELALSSLSVEKLVIPAISELHETWTSVFGFKPLEESKRQEMKHMSVIVFPGIDLLEKPITLKDPTGKITTLSMENQAAQEAPDKPDMVTSCTDASHEIIIRNAHGIKDVKNVECNSDCGKEIKASTFSHIVSDSSDCDEKAIHATEEGKEKAFEFKQKKDCTSLAEKDSSRSSAKGLEHSQNGNIVLDCLGSGDCTMFSDSVIQIKNSHGGIIDSTSCEPEIVANAFPNSTTGPGSHSNGFSKSSELQTKVDTDVGTVGVAQDTSSEAIRDSKDKCVVSESNHGSFDANTTLHDASQSCSNPFELSEQDFVGADVDDFTSMIT